MQAELKRQKIFNLIYSHPSYQKSIKSDLQKIAKKVFTSAQLIQKLKQFSILTYTHRDYSHKSKSSTSYSQLQKQYTKQLPDIFSNMANIILEYQTKQPKFPIMYAQSQIQYTFNKKQKLLLMSMMAMSLITNQDCRFKYKFPNIIDFRYMFCQQDYKTTTIIQYFKKQFGLLNKLGADYQKQKLTLRRIVQNRSIANIVAQNKQKPMLPTKIAHDKQSIQQYFGQVKVDFANKFIGGGALGSGCVQEQIMFANHPQMFISVLFCQVMKQNQAIEFIGYKKYFNNYGYAHTTSYGGQEKYQYQYDQKNRAKEYIVAIDALHYPGKRHQSQFTLQKINRELLKAYTGFYKSGYENSKIVTGNWGCGAFNGNIPLKFVIQWLACSMAGKEMVYTPFGYGDKLKNAQHIQDKISKMTVGEVYKLIQDSQKELYDTRDLFKTISTKMEQL